MPRTSLKVTKGKLSLLHRCLIYQADIQFLGTPNTYDAVGDSGKVNKHFFCPTCGSSLYTELELMPEMTCIKGGGLDNGEANLGGKIDVEFYVKDRPSYLAAVEGAKQESALGN